MSSANEVRFLALSDEGKENLTIAFKFAEERGLKCIWVNTDVTKRIALLEDEVVYVIDPIQGPEADGFVNSLVGLKYPVVGPQCILSMLKHSIQLQVDMKYPVYTLSMVGTIICFSNILNDERKELVRLVELMGGEVSRPLHHAVTHLVVGEVGSVKYFTAASLGMKIMIKQWIHDLWKRGSSRHVCARKGKWEDFLCPIFLGCSVCMTGFSASEKTEVQNLINKFGGQYSGAMKLGLTTHLVVNKPEGQKYVMAAKFGVKVVNVNWVYESIENGACKDSDHYPIKTAPTGSLRQSTPDKCARFSRIESMDNVSSIDPSLIDETVASAMGDVSVMSFAGVSVRSGTTDLWSFPTNRDYSETLDGVHVYLAGFLPDEEERMGKLLSLGSAIKYTQLTSSVNRVLVGNLSRISSSTRSEICTACAQNSDLNIVDQKWILDSLTKGKMLPEKDYRHELMNPSQETHGTSEKQVTGMNRAASHNDTTLNDESTTFRQEPYGNRSVTDRDSSILGLMLPEDENESTMLSQYICAKETDPTNESTFTHEDTLHQGTGTINVDDNRTWISHNDTTDVQSSVTGADENAGFFSRRTFFVLGFVVEELQNMILEIELNGGFVLAADSKKVADYVVVPLTGWLVDKTAHEVVTVFWLKLCVELGRLIDPSTHKMCTPFSVPPHSSPLRGCVTCLSKYIDSERVYLNKLIVELGGIVQDIVARRDVNNMLQTTHLIVSEPGGEKYTGCKKWGIAIVTEKWVYECAQKGKKLDEQEFLVTERMAKDESCPPPTRFLEFQEKNISLTADNAAINAKQSYASHNIKEFPPIPRPPSVVNKIRKRLKAKVDMQKRATENEMKINKDTPAGVRYRRMMSQTPSKFAAKGAVPTNVTFDITDVFQLLKTPIEEQKKIRAEMQKNPGTPMSEFLIRCLDKGVANIPDHLIQNLEKKLLEQESILPHDNEGETFKNADTTGRSGDNMFEGLVVSLARKFHKEYADLAKIISSHGGEFRWTYDNMCTHFLYQGTLHDKNKEFLIAKKDKKFIVSPHWVKACVQSGSKVDETLFPHVYHPDRSIQFDSSPVKARDRSLQEHNPSQISAFGQSTTHPGNKDSNQSLCERGDSKERKDSLEKKLENILATTSVTKEMQIRRLSCATTYTPPQQNRATPFTSMAAKGLDSAKLSQDVQVSWDDPTGREEMERLMNNGNVPVESKAVEENLAEDLPLGIKEASPRCFITSSVSALDKTKYSSIIKELGGEFSDSSVLVDQVTHLLVSKPGKSEKYLSALASGRYILQPEYLEACKEAGNFLPEDKYEYGNPVNPYTESLLRNPNSIQNQIPLSAYRWRKKLDYLETERSVREGAFMGWKVVLDVNERQSKGFKRLLQCGSAEVVANKLQDVEFREFTHAFIDVEMAKEMDMSFMEDLVTQTEVHICNPTFIGDYLLKDPPPRPQSYYVPQFQAILDKLNPDDGAVAKKRRTE